MFAWGGAALFALSLAFFLYSYLVSYGSVATARSAWPALSADVLLFTAFALHHSAFARTGLKTRMQEWLSPALERSVYTWIASLLFIVVCAAWQPIPGEAYHLTGLAAAAGYGVQIAGIFLTARSSARLDVLDLAGVRQVMDDLRGVAPRHVALETRGLYGLVRHPVYLSWVLFVFAAPHMTFTRLTFAAVSTLYLAIAIPFEERTLVHVFGADYRAYQQRVRWKMLPGIY